MTAFGGKAAPLPPDVSSAHFTNQELQSLYKDFCAGNGFDDPAQIAALAERVYDAIPRDPKVPIADPIVSQMRADGLGFFLRKVCEKKIELGEADPPGSTRHGSGCEVLAWAVGILIIGVVFYMLS